MEQSLATGMDAIIATISDRGLGVLAAIAILVIGRIAAGMIRAGVKRSMTAAKMDETLVPFVGGVTYFGSMAVVVMMALGSAGFNTTSLVAVFGAAGLAIALAFQSTISNFAAGLMLLIFRPISVGHFVDVGGTSGTVAKIDVFTTALDTPDNVHIIVPNSAIFGQTIVNYSANERRRIDLVIGVSYDDDLGRAIEVITGVVKSDARVLTDPEFVIAVHELGDSSVNLVVRPWCRAEDYWTLRWDLTRAIKDVVDSAGLSFPFPQRDVHLHQAG